MDVKTGVIISDTLPWYWVEDTEWQPLEARQVRKRWCRDNFGFLWKSDITKWYFTKESDRMLYILTWM